MDQRIKIQDPEIMALEDILLYNNMMSSARDLMVFNLEDPADINTMLMNEG